MVNNLDVSELLIIGVPHGWKASMEKTLEDELFSVLFSSSKDDAIKIIQSRELCAVIITSDFVFHSETNQDILSLTYAKIPTLTIIRKETVEKLGQEVVFDKVYNPKAFQEFCTAPFDMNELILRLKKIIQKSQKACL